MLLRLRFAFRSRIRTCSSITSGVEHTRGRRLQTGVPAVARAGLFCETMSHSFGSPVQTAWVTQSLDTTEKALTGLLGVKKWVRLPDVHFAPDSCNYRGAPADFVASISLSYLGDMQLELIEPISGANIYSEFLQDSGPGLHHICVEADTLENFDAALVSAVLSGDAGALTRSEVAEASDAGSPASSLTGDTLIW